MTETNPPTILTPGISEPVPSAPEIVLSEQQNLAVQQIGTWYKKAVAKKGKLEFRLGGFAGTGKTTIIKWIIQHLKCYPAVAAYTGKAVSVLHHKGLYQATTLHSLLYEFYFDPFERKYIQSRRDTLPDVDLVIIDEASMVSSELYKDLCRHDIPLLFVGDPAQLEPIGDNPNLMRQTDYTLTEIHRQAAGNPILRLASAVRQGLNDIPAGEWVREQGSLLVTHKRANPNDFDVALCGKNATRHLLNGIVRSRRGYTLPLVEGETIIILKNSRDYRVFNGMTLTVTRIGRERTLGGDHCVELNLKDDLGNEYEVPCLTEFLGKDSKQTFSRAVPIDWGYALTCHKSQGSEFDNVLVMDERLYQMDHNRWRYTAFTRSAKTLTVCL